MWLVILLLLSVVFIVVATTKLKLHPFLALLIGAFGYGVFCGRGRCGHCIVDYQPNCALKKEKPGRLNPVAACR